MNIIKPYWQLTASQKTMALKIKPKALGTDLFALDKDGKVMSEIKKVS